MQCTTCRHESPADSRFCLECGTPLPVRCPRCDAELPTGSKFCNRCGTPIAAAGPGAERDPRAYTPQHLAEKILISRAALAGERKQVTVLFGAPIAHEDHAQRACWAALHLQEAVRGYADELRRRRSLNFSVRMGLNSGEVVVGRIGDDLRMDYTAQGHTVGLAQRMEQLAEVGRVYLTEHTAALVAGFFRLRDLGVFTVKGVREPIRAHDLEGAGTHRTRLDVARARGFSRLVGRQEETTTLEAALAHALDGQGQVVGV